MSEKKVIWVNIIKVLLFLGILLGLLAGIQTIFTPDSGHRGTDVVKGFYAEKKNDMEVLFLGSSTMFCTMDPLVLYENYGITSYDFGCSAQAFEAEYMYLKEALKYQKPKVIGLEVTGIRKGTDPDNLETWSYAMTDMRLSWNKISEGYRMLKSNKAVYAAQLIPLLQYKERWKELTREDFLKKSEKYYAKGAYTPDKITEEPLDFSTYNEIVDETIPEENKEALDKIVKLCKQENIQLLLIKAPNIGWTIRNTEQVEKLAEKYDLPFINYFDLLEKLEIDPANDFRDFSHFNRIGSEKASIYLGEYLIEHYDLTDRRQDRKKNSWDISLELRAQDREDTK